MARFSTPQEFREHVLAAAGMLPPQQRAIADYLIHHLEEFPFLALPELARISRVSEPTIVRFAQSLGFRGYRDLKVELLQLPNATAEQPSPKPFEPSGERNVLRSVAQLEMDNIRATVDLITVQTLEHVADLLHHSDHTYVFGMGVSAPLAITARYILTEVGVRCSRLSNDFTAPTEQLFALRAGDLLLAFSFPPYSRPTLELLEGARDRGATTVAITNSLASPAAAIAAWTLPVRTHNMMFTNAVAAIIVVLNAIATEYAVRHRSHSLNALAHMSRSWTSSDLTEPEIEEDSREQ